MSKKPEGSDFRTESRQTCACALMLLLFFSFGVLCFSLLTRGARARVALIIMMFQRLLIIIVAPPEPQQAAPPWMFLLVATATSIY